MNTSVYSVPSSKPLDDKLIRDVVLRARIPQSRKGRSYQKTHLPNLGQIATQFDGNTLSPPKPTSKTNQFPSTITPSASTVDVMRLVETNTVGPSEVDMLNCMAAAEALIRQRRRIQQRKYRKQQRQHTDNLVNDVRKIQEEIQMLEQQLQYTSVGISKSQTLWGAATDYFRIFRYGFTSPTTDAEYTCALNVLESYMAPNMRDGFACGPKAVLTRWVMFTRCFDDIFVDLQRLEKGPIENSVVATVITRITISNDSLRLVFPHLTLVSGVDRSSGSTVTSLAAKLLGQQLVVRGSVIFEWDSKIGLVSRLQSQSDMLTPLLRVLGNLEDVSRVFEGSLLTPECSWPQILL